MDRSSASSEISFHGLPSKSKRPSIRKHSVVVIITANSISFYETRHLQRDIQQIYFRQDFCELLENSSSTSKYVPKSFRKFTKIHPWLSLMLVKFQAFTGATTGCVLSKLGS